MSKPSAPTDSFSFATIGDQFQAAMDPVHRHQKGAHYTSEVDILRVVGPSILNPFRTRLDTSHTDGELSNLLADIRSHRVLDPSCGSGNFLYVAFRTLRWLEDQVIDRMCALGAPQQTPQVGLHQLFGIDRDEGALQIASTLLREGRDLLGGPDTRPHLQSGDALFIGWPEVDVIVGNPPFQSKNKRQQVWGADAVHALKEAYPNIPGRADYCVYFFRRAHDHLKPGQRAGLVGTNTIRENDSRIGGLEYIVGSGGTIVDAVANQRWGGDAVVYVSIVNWIKGSPAGPFPLRWQQLDGSWKTVQRSVIPSSLSPYTDVTGARQIQANRKPKRAFQGQTHGHAGFLVPREEALRLLANQPTWDQVLHPFLNGKELLKDFGLQPSRYVIDFGDRSEQEAMQFGSLFERIRATVYPTRQTAAAAERERNRTARGATRLNHHHQNFLKRWWTLSYPRLGLTRSIAKKPRYIACSRVTRHPIFRFIDATIRPSDALAVFDFDDAYSLGILQSELHGAWFAARCSTLGTGLRYTSSSVFDTFPWPQRPTKETVRGVADAALALLDCRQTLWTRRGGTLTTLYGSAPEALQKAHRTLNERVAQAYGLPAHGDHLDCLLRLNEICNNRERNDEWVAGAGPPSSQSFSSTIDLGFSSTAGGTSAI